jgi:hypothetical protein
MRGAKAIFAMLLGLAWPFRPGSWQAAVQSATPQAHVVDRIVVRIEEDILTLSELRELEGFQQLANGASGAARTRTTSEAELIKQMIDQWIVQAEATSSRFPRPTSEDVRREMERLERLFASREDYHARLRELGLTAESVARQVEQQLYLSRYLDYKFRPAAQIEGAQVEKYYQQELIPELQKHGQQAPPVEKVEGQIRELLTQREISARAAQWLEETRARLKIEVLRNGSTR